MGVGHYENFPVASLLLPARLRPAVRAIYRFARTADDVADEGDALPEDRLRELAGPADATSTTWTRPIPAGPTSRPPCPSTVCRCPCLHDLLSAFAQDVTTRRYADYASLVDYCRRSANPIGRLLLSLYRRDEPGLLAMSDAICTGLQLTNFWQDVAIDWDKGRVYLPARGSRALRRRRSADRRRLVDDRWRALMAFEVARARALLQQRRPARPARSAVASDSNCASSCRAACASSSASTPPAATCSGTARRCRARDWTMMGLRALRPVPDAA